MENNDIVKIIYWHLPFGRRFRFEIESMGEAAEVQIPMHESQKSFPARPGLGGISTGPLSNRQSLCSISNTRSLFYGATTNTTSPTLANRGNSLPLD